jgi:hypothetical protein
LKFSLNTVVGRFVAPPVRFTLPPAQTVVGVLVAETAVGPGFTTTVTVLVPGTEHPVFKPVIVYVVVVVGLAVTTGPVVPLKPVAGDQL